MSTLAVVLSVVNLALLVVLLLVVIVRTRRTAVPVSPVEDPREAVRELRQDLSAQLSAQRSELGQALATGHQQLDVKLQSVSTGLADTLARDRESLVSEQREQRALLERRLTALAEQLHNGSRAALQSQVESKEQLQRTLSDELDKMRQGNEAKLDKMREVVDEKLQGTLERRLGESFKLVSERLEQVQKGLGEMQTLASDVGGLKRVLTNVKNRGSWGEVQLSRQLEDILTRDQYDENVVIRPGSRDSVEFAVKLPGRGEGEAPVYLPIDSKLPQEDYEQLLSAQEAGDKDAVEAATKNLDRVILTQAKLISEKYIEPPHSTDFALMYLPTEGLFAEVIRRPGLASRLQTELRVMITGPTTLMSLLNSLQMGFRTVAIEKRSSEVWQVLSAAKTEFIKYGQVWTKLEKQLQTAQNTVHDAGVRTRAVERRLRSVETLEPIGPISALEMLGDREDTAEDIDTIDDELNTVPDVR